MEKIVTCLALMHVIVVLRVVRGARVAAGTLSIKVYMR